MFQRCVETTTFQHFWMQAMNEMKLLGMNVECISKTSGLSGAGAVENFLRADDFPVGKAKNDHNDPFLCEAPEETAPQRLQRLEAEESAVSWRHPWKLMLDPWLGANHWLQGFSPSCRSSTGGNESFLTQKMGGNLSRVGKGHGNTNVEKQLVEVVFSAAFPLMCA